MWETQSSTEWSALEVGPTFTPNRFVDISAQLDRKRLALECYAEEMHPFPHTRSWKAVEALARWRGASVGFEAAEAYQILREIC